jgi:hypothetical protein
MESACFCLIFSSSLTGGSCCIVRMDLGAEMPLKTLLAVGVEGGGADVTGGGKVGEWG